MERRSSAPQRSLTAPRTARHTAPHTPPQPQQRQRIAARPHTPPPEAADEAPSASPDPPPPPVLPARQRLVSPPPLRLVLRPTVSKFPRITERRRLLISHQPLRERAAHWPARQPPEERTAQRAVRRRRGQGGSSKGPVYLCWGAGVLGGALVSVLGSPHTLHALDAAKTSPVWGVTCLIAMVYDMVLTRQNARGARHDYLMAAILLQQERATLEALRLEHERTGHPINPQDQGALAFNIGVLESMLQRFEAAYYPRSQQPYLQQIREQIAEAARALAQDIAEVDALARERQALLWALNQAAPGEREDLLLELQEIDALSNALQAAIAERQQNVQQLLSRRRLRQRAEQALSQAQGELAHAQRLAQARARVKTLSSEAAAARLALSQAPQDAARQSASRAAQAALRVASIELKRLAQHFAPWQQAMLDWVALHRRAPNRPQQAQILQGLLQGLQHRVDALQQEIVAFRSEWWRGFFWYEGLSKEATKRLRDLLQQGMKLPLQFTLSALSTAALAVDLVGLAFGQYGLTLLSSGLSMLMARGDNKDGRLEQQEATLAKLTAWTRLCRASELMARAEGFADEATRALAQAAARALTVCMQRALRVLGRATTQAQIRRTKGELNYLLLVIGVVGGAASLGTGGAAAPFVALPSALVGSLYLGSVCVRALQHKALKDEAQAREAVALAFVRAFGVDQILAFYIDMQSGEAERLLHWRQRLRGLSAHWTHGLRRPHAELQQLLADECRPERLWDNEFLMCQCFSELMHRHARDQLHGPCAAAELLRFLEMGPQVIDHLMKHFGGFATPAAHRRSTLLHLAAFVGAKPYPLARLPGHIDRSPAESAARVEAVLQHGLAQLSVSTRRQTLDLLSALQAQGEQAISRLTRTERGLQRTLTRWLEGLRERLQRDFIGPHELLALQQALIEAPGAGDTFDALPQLGSAIGPLWLELLAEPSYLQRRPAPVAEALPDPAPGPPLLAALTAAIKLIGRALRDGDLQAALDLPLQHRPAPRERASTSLVVNALRLAPDPGAAHGAGARRPPLLRRLSQSASERGRGALKRVRQTGRNPMGTPEKALAHLDDLPEDQAARVCGWVLEQLVRQHHAERQAELPRSAPVVAQLKPQDALSAQRAAHLRAWLAAVNATALRTADALRQRRMPRAMDGAIVARMQAICRLCERLRDSLEHPLTQAQLRGVRLID